MTARSDKLRRQRVLLETDRHLIVGEMTLPSDGYQGRFSDVINRADVAFIQIVDVEITPLEGGEAQRREFVVVSKAHIRLAYPLDEGSQGPLR
jgi:hypothetical protein